MCILLSPIGPISSFSSTDRSPLTPTPILSPSTNTLPGGAAPPRTPGEGTPAPCIRAPQHQAPPRGGAPTHLLDVLLEDTELQPLGGAAQLRCCQMFSSCRWWCSTSWMTSGRGATGLRVVGRGRERKSELPGRQGPLELVEQGLPVLAHLRRDTRAIISQRVLQKRGSAQATPRSPPSRARQAYTDTCSPTHPTPNCKSEFHSKACFIKTK